MSFINLMASNVWSAADIVRRTEAELHGQISKESELILSRKMIGFSLGLMIPTAEEAAELTLYEMAAYQAQESGIAARSDMALLQSALDHEAAQRRLANPALAVDANERRAAQALLDAAGDDTLALVALRNPEPVADPEERT
jgi:hypothetical protein